MHLIGFLMIGLVAGWLAQQIMKGSGGGLIINLDRFVTYSIGEKGILKGVWADGKGTQTLMPK